MEQTHKVLNKTYKQAVRVTFSYDRDAVTLIGQQPVRMTVFPSHPLTKYEEQSGFWYIIKDESGKALYRRIIQNPIRVEQEIFSNNPSEGIIRKPIAHPKGQFQILIPNISQATSLEFMSSPLEIDKQFHPAKILTKFSLKTIQKHK